MVEVGLVSGLHSEVLTSEGSGENSQTEADTVRPQSWHQEG